MRIKIDLQVCEGHARCVVLAPELFEVRDDGLAYLTALAAEGRDEDIEAARRAALSCPEGAIVITELGGDA